MTKIKKAIAIIAMLATVTACFAGCSDSGTNSTASKSDSSTQSQAAEEEKNEESEVKEEEEAPAADIPSDYKLPASPEIIVYQGDKEVFHYAGETTSEVRNTLENMGIEGDNKFKVIKDYRLTIDVYPNNISIDVNKLYDDMRVVVDGLEVNLDTMNAIASDGTIASDTSTFKPADWKTEPNASLQFIVSGNTGNVTGCIIQLNNVPEN